MSPGVATAAATSPVRRAGTGLGNRAMAYWTDELGRRPAVPAAGAGGGLRGPAVGAYPGRTGGLPGTPFTVKASLR
jgi:hypothetical protein